MPILLFIVIVIVVVIDVVAVVRVVLPVLGRLYFTSKKYAEISGLNS